MSETPRDENHAITFFQPPNRPTGGTVYVRPESARRVSFFDVAPPERPTGGGTVYTRSSDVDDEETTGVNDK